MPALSFPAYNGQFDMGYRCTLSTNSVNIIITPRTAPGRSGKI